MQEAGESFAAPTQDTEEGPPRTEGVVPLPQSERAGRREATQGGESFKQWVKSAVLAVIDLARRFIDLHSQA